MNKELMEALDILEKEKEISKETLFEAIEVDADIAPDIALHHAGHHILFLLIVLVVDNASLLLADFLENHVLGIHGGDTPKLLGLDFIYSGGKKYAEGAAHQCEPHPSGAGEAAV